MLVLTTHVENGFQKKLKSRAVFLDLLASYHTVSKRGLLLKLAKIIKCKITLRLLEQTLSNRNFKVYLNSEVSRRKIVQNDLPQRSVLLPTLFNVYTTDITETISRKYILNEDFKTLQIYFLNWYLTLNANKITAVTFHLNNRKAKRELQLKIGDINISNEVFSKYLGVKLDRTLTFKQHLDSTKKQNNFAK